MRMLICQLGLFAIVAGASAPRTAYSDDLAPAKRQRAPWTTSRVHGSPEPPPPYRMERIYPRLAFKQPVEMIDFPGGTKVCVVERLGQIHLFDRTESAAETTLLLDGGNDLEGLNAAYGLAFHPDFDENRYCYVCYILGAEIEDGTRVSRFRVTDTDPPRIDPQSETILITWLSGGHNGGSLKFGPDGYLYISTGDASPPSPPDIHDTGQDISDLLSSILRIDVDHADGERPYAIPADNPFVDMAGIAPEVWSYGFRNPWRMSFDRGTGDLWLGDVGWQLWEMVFRVERGANYGWSVMEGPQEVRPESRRGPTPILPPVVAHPRSDAASVTGGYVYHGSRLADLVGAYVYGDYVTGKIWGLRVEGNEVTWHRELVDTPVSIICFYESPEGEIAFLGYNSGEIYRLAPNEQTSEETAAFPRRLSETGLFTSTERQEPAAGVVPFSVNVQQWADHATAERFLAVPDTGTIVLRDPQERVPSNWGEFPADTVLVKTISMEMERGNPASRRRIETQILHVNGESWRSNSGEWRGYTYVWNDDQTDAVLAPAEGLDIQLEVVDPEAPGGRRQHDWRIHSRSECYYCHNPWAGYRLGFTARQLYRPGEAGDQEQTVALQSLDLLKLADVEDLADRHFVDPYDESADLDRRARSYLHVNCAHCHRVGGGGTATIDLRAELDREAMQIVARPTQGTFRIVGAEIVVPGEPLRSVLYYRCAKLGRGRMPHVGSQFVDERALAMLDAWIRDLDPDRSGESHLADSWLDGSAPNDETIDAALSRTNDALAIMEAVASGAIAEPVRDRVIARAAGHELPEIRDLFERFLPPEARTKRLGSSIDEAPILAVSGDAARGRRVFHESAAAQCKSCHRIGEVGNAIGPDLSHIGKDRTAAELLASIVRPSEKIDPKFVMFLVETKDGQVESGLLLESTAEQIVIRTTQNQDLRFRRDDIENLAPQNRSLMPELLFRDMTAEQLADLLAYLKSLQ